MTNVSVQDNLKLSILDFAYVYHGSTPTEVLENSTEVVRLADELGYTSSIGLQNIIIRNTYSHCITRFISFTCCWKY